MVFQFAPYPADLGPAKRNFPFFQENLKRHDVTVLSFGTPEEKQKIDAVFGDKCRVVYVNNKRPRALNFLLRIWLLLTGRSSYRRFYSWKMQRAIDQLVKEEQFDLIHCCTTMLGYHKFPRHIPLVGDTHNVEYDAVYRAYKQTSSFVKPYFYWEYLRVKQEELQNCEPFHVMIATTQQDYKKFRAVLPNKKIHIIPNGVDLAFFQNQKVKEEERTLVFTGLMSYYPNNHGILYFLDEIFPLILEQAPDAKITIVGAEPPKKLQRRASDNITVTGFVDDVKPYFARGQVFVIPLKIGGGIRGKALEAMAMRRPIVSTTLGCEGINLKHEDSALFADTPEEFAQAVIRMFNEPELRTRLTEKAYRNVLDGYSWEVNGLALDRVYQSLLDKHKAPALSRTHSFAELPEGEQKLA
ncbi:MAG: glycosyltransferase [Ignavibacteriae bacterium]|nr:glycosyltransferase [Ignavibacteriota bacterium]